MISGGIVVSRFVTGFTHTASSLVCDGVELQAIADAEGTPLYVYSAAALRERFRALDDAFDGAAFNGDYLFEMSRGRKAPVKAFLMDQKIVVGVGNIYAAEALFDLALLGIRHDVFSSEAELQAAKTLSTNLGAVEHVVAEIDLRIFGGSALTDDQVSSCWWTRPKRA